MVQSLAGAQPSLVLANAVDGRVLATGHLLFMRAGTLMFVEFDATSGTVTGTPETVMNGVMQSGLRAHAGAGNTAAGMFSVSSTGHLAFIPGPLVGPAEGRLVWVGLDGTTSSAHPAAGAPAGGNLAVRVAPHRRQAVVNVSSAVGRETWFVDWQRDVWSRCENCERSVGVWSPDASRLLFAQNDELVVRTVDGSAARAVRAKEPGRALAPVEWIDGDTLVYTSSTLNFADTDLKVLEPGAAKGKSVAALGSGHSPALSPDKQWLAFSAVIGGKPEVVVQAFPGPGPRLQVSAGGANPTWSADGKSLYYLAAVNVMSAVQVLTSPRLSVTRPKEIFRREPMLCAPMRCYDISRDGRFLIGEHAADKRQSAKRIDLVLNWRLPNNE